MINVELSSSQLAARHPSNTAKLWRAVIRRISGVLTFGALERLRTDAA